MEYGLKFIFTVPELTATKWYDTEQARDADFIKFTNPDTWENITYVDNTVINMKHIVALNKVDRMVEGRVETNADGAESVQSE